MFTIMITISALPHEVPEWQTAATFGVNSAVGIGSMIASIIQASKSSNQRVVPPPQNMPMIQSDVQPQPRDVGQQTSVGDNSQDFRQKFNFASGRDSSEESTSGSNPEDNE